MFLRILVISDSHKRSDLIEKALYAQPTATHVFFLGDVASDIEDYTYIFPEKQFHILSGNCDYFSTFPSTAIEKVSGKNIFYTHGHTLGVKSSTEHLLKTAKAQGCEIALFGHTHIPLTLYEDGVWLVNPGSIGHPRGSKATYAVIDIENNGIMPIIIEV